MFKGWKYNREAQVEHITLNVDGMKCGGCENGIKTALSACDGVAEVTASHKDKTVAVGFDPAKVSLEQIKQTIVAQGFQVS
ncbi:heavy-metal-associated domain-containing protein [Methylogaea oryzae]|uniref:HMA domain-containing protein n=1 Tax=Methylogaea oryzae TaxID=1295382 RepID=A0A8D4VRV5_9GAMM|nr:heavy-metal-associated domain-containing protein [Methylogaea oryzae]BBL71230.1 hypothetical protein MoryE10_18360 [Methylogaea oryzae]